MQERYYLERHFQQDFGKWARHNLSTNCLLELKVSKTYSLPFSRLEEHQLSALKAAKHGKLFFKIPDGSAGRLPADCFMLAGAEAFVVVMFRCTEIGQKEFFLIDIDQWDKELAGDRRSLTESRARVIGQVAYLA